MNGCHFGDFRVRMLLLGGLALLLTAVTVGKLYYEQIDRGEAHRERISRQSIRRIRRQTAKQPSVQLDRRMRQQG